MAHSELVLVLLRWDVLSGVIAGAAQCVPDDVSAGCCIRARVGGVLVGVLVIVVSWCKLAVGEHASVSEHVGDVFGEFLDCCGGEVVVVGVVGGVVVACLETKRRRRSLTI